MALIDCPECGREVSSSAATCPECAYPLTTSPGITARTVLAEPPRDPWWKVFMPLAARIFVGMILIGVGMDEGEITGIIGGLIIGGSAIPAWYRHKIDRLRGRGGGDIGARVEARLRELADRHREQIAQLERTQAGQIAELEERIDFAERLLTKTREQP